jgi:hypothetical protein
MPPGAAFLTEAITTLYQRGVEKIPKNLFFFRCFGAAFA